MNESLKSLLTKLGTSYPNYEISTKSLATSNQDEFVVTIQLTVFQSEYCETSSIIQNAERITKEHRSVIVKKVDGVGISLDRIEATEKAIVHGINLIGIY